MTNRIVTVIRNMILAYDRAITGTKPHAGAGAQEETKIYRRASDGKVTKVTGPGTQAKITWSCVLGNGCGHRDLCSDTGHCVENPFSPVRPPELIHEGDPAYNDLQTYLEEPGDCPACQHPAHYSGNGLCAFLCPPEGSPPVHPVCLCGDRQEAARRLDQASVDHGQLSPGAFRDTWGSLPRPGYDSHKLWCARWRNHGSNDCPVWGDE